MNIIEVFFLGKQQTEVGGLRAVYLSLGFLQRKE